MKRKTKKYTKEDLLAAARVMGACQDGLAWLQRCKKKTATAAFKEAIRVAPGHANWLANKSSSPRRVPCNFACCREAAVRDARSLVSGADRWVARFVQLAEKRIT